jgi:hypothetical protein
MNGLIKDKLFLFFLLIGNMSVHAQTFDFSNAILIASPSIQSPVRETLLQTLQEELKQRTFISLPVADAWNSKRPVIALVLSSHPELAGKHLPVIKGDNLPEFQPEGFRITIETNGLNPVLWLTGNDARGILYAVGEFLRKAELSRKKIGFDKKYEIASSPTYSIRGHQLGYRNTNNTCDAWTAAQYEKYIRELALFGANSIENIPLDDDIRGELRKLPKAEMDAAISTICNKYDLDYWVWTPATVDLSDETLFRNEVARHADIYKACPRLDAVFVPGGDPGDNHPQYVIPFLKEIATKLKQYHPKAGIWLSLQGFNDEQTDYFFRYIIDNQPDWLRGVVSGPGSPDMAMTRYRLPKKYLHRHYPDITHTVRCQYPVPDFDQAFALTLGREASNPQPFHYAQIHRQTEQFTDGSITYSDGNHDDINKIVFTRLDWNPDEEIRVQLEDYARFFFGSVDAANIAEGILALEKNWFGPVEENGAIACTLAFWNEQEASHPELKNNWRWIQLVMRANYDYYVQQRKLYEQNLEKEAVKILKNAEEIGADKATDQALEIVNRAKTAPILKNINTKIRTYCEQLYQLIGMQTSVDKYYASGAERGCILDFIDYPLNNRWWMEDEFNKIRQMSSEQEKLTRLEVIRTWDYPGEGNYYDNISDVSRSPHVKSHTDDAIDYVWWDKGLSRKRLSTQLFQFFPVLVYDNLDANASYTIRISGIGEALLRVNGARIAPTVYPKEMELFKEFYISGHHLKNGKLTVTFDEPEESNLNWRQQSKICDIWLIKNKE